MAKKMTLNSHVLRETIFEESAFPALEASLHVYFRLEGPSSPSEACLGNEMLRCFLERQLDRRELPRVIEHLADCTLCTDRLIEMKRSSIRVLLATFRTTIEELIASPFRQPGLLAERAHLGSSRRRKPARRRHVAGAEGETRGFKWSIEHCEDGRDLLRVEANSQWGRANQVLATGSVIALVLQSGENVRLLLVALKGTADQSTGRSFIPVGYVPRLGDDEYAFLVEAKTMPRELAKIVTVSRELNLSADPDVAAIWQNFNAEG